MRLNLLFTVTCVTLLLLLTFGVMSPSVGASALLGPRGGYDFDSDDLVFGVEAEVGRLFHDFRLAPSADFEFGDNALAVLNADLRLYLFHLPETGLQFYGSTGPAVLLDSGGKGDSEMEIGLSLVAGMKIPMNGPRRYNLEARFGLGDIPEFKLILAVLFDV